MSDEKPKQTGGGDEEETADKDKVEKQSVTDAELTAMKSENSDQDQMKSNISGGDEDEVEKQSAIDGDGEDKAFEKDKAFDDEMDEKKKQNSDKDVTKNISDVPTGKSSANAFVGDPHQDHMEHLAGEVETMRREFADFRNEMRTNIDGIFGLMRTVLHQMRPAGQASGDIAVSASSGLPITSAAGVQNVFSHSQRRNTNRSAPNSENLAMNRPVIDSGFVQSDSGSHLSADGRHSDHGSDGSARGSNA